MFIKEEKIEGFITQIFLFVPLISALVCYFVLIKNFEFNIVNSVGITLLWNVTFFSMLKIQKYSENEQKTKKRISIAVLLLCFAILVALLLIEIKPTFLHNSNLDIFAKTFLEVYIGLLFLNAIIYAIVNGVITLLCTGFVILHEHKKLFKHIILLISLVAMTLTTYINIKPYSSDFNTINKTLVLKAYEHSNISYLIPVTAEKISKDKYCIEQMKRFYKSELIDFVAANQQELLKEKYVWKNGTKTKAENRILNVHLDEVKIYNTEFKLNKYEIFKVEITVGIYMNNRKVESTTHYMDVYATLQ